MVVMMTNNVHQDFSVGKGTPIAVIDRGKFS